MRVLAGVLVYLAVAASSEDVDHRLSDTKAENSEPGSVQIGGNRFLGVSSTTTYTSVVMVTSTVFFSCLSGTSAAVCGGRRRRKSVPTVVKLDDENLGGSPDGKALDSSLVDPDGTESDTSSSSSPQEANKDGKFQFLTIWSAASTTTTVTMLYTDTNTTVRLSYYCQAGFQNLPDGCAG